LSEVSEDAGELTQQVRGAGGVNGTTEDENTIIEDRSTAFRIEDISQDQ